MKIIVLGLLGLFVAFAVYVRVAPTNTEVWHNPKLPVMVDGEYPRAVGFVSQSSLDGKGMKTLVRLDGIIRKTQRTTVLAGAVDVGKITYVTRSRVMGFPDYTTVRLSSRTPFEKSSLQVFGRLRFGQSDIGVNRARIEGWLTTLYEDTNTQ